MTKHDTCFIMIDMEDKNQTNSEQKEDNDELEYRYEKPIHTYFLTTHIAGFEKEDEEKDERDT